MYRSIRIRNVDPPSMRIQVEKPGSPSRASPVFRSHYVRPVTGAASSHLDRTVLGAAGVAP